MKKINLTAITVLASLTITLFLLLMNDIMISIRLNELKSSLQNMDSSEGSIDNIGLVATYELHKKLFENRITQDDADAIEHRIISLAAPGAGVTPRTQAMYSILAYPALTVINFNRMVLGKAPLAYRPGKDPWHVKIDLAYYYERNFHFKRAIEIYDDILATMDVTSGLMAGIFLHKGYCHALLGHNDLARRDYLTVIEKYSQESSAITATILLKYLEGYKLARERVMEQDANPLLKGQKLVTLLAYQQALLILEKAERTAGPRDLPGIQYYMGRCFAGMGDTDKAVESYLNVITSSPSSKYAIFSNRKLFITGSSAGDAALKNLSIGLNRIYNDPLMDRMIEDGEGIRADIKKDEMPIKIRISPDLKASVDTMVAKEKASGLKKGRYLVIFTSDGNIFKGTLIEKTADHIAIETLIGRIDVKKDRIIRVTEK